MAIHRWIWRMHLSWRQPKRLAKSESLPSTAISTPIGGAGDWRSRSSRDQQMKIPLPFEALIVASIAKDHQRMIAAARPFFARMGMDHHFDVEFTDDAETINDENLKQYQVFVMLHLAPFDMTYPQQEALQKFIESGKGWVGIHAAGLTGKQFRKD